MGYLLLFWSFGLLLTVGCGKNSNERKTEKIGKEMALVQTQIDTNAQVKFPVYDYEGLKPLLYKNDGKTYVINFWATWCKPCIEELPYFEKVYSEQKDNNVEFFLVSLDMPSMWKSRLEPFVEKKGLKSKVVILDDPKQNEWIAKIDENWGGGIPATLIYNKDKRTFYERGFTYEELNNELNKFINQ